MDLPDGQPVGWDLTHPLKIFDAARSKNKFVYACAPMVRYGKLAFRQTVREYGTDLCWTPMILAKEFTRNNVARDSDLTLSPSHNSPPTIVQFGSNSPLDLSRAASLVAPWTNGVDLNCGCPQSWACAETLGAALMDHRELVRDMVVATRGRLADDGWAMGLERDVASGRGRSVSVKIRIHKDLRQTIDFLHTVIGDKHNRNIDFLTIHPRTRRTPSSTPINAESLSILLSTFGDTLPILLSGDVFTLDALPFGVQPGPVPSALNGPIRDRDPAHESSSAASSLASLTLTPVPSQALTPASTGLAGFMSARGLLANPALFAGYTACPWEAVETFIRNVIRAPIPFKLTLHHLSEMCGPGMGPDKSSLLTKKERLELLGLGNICDVLDFLDAKIAQKTGRDELRRETQTNLRNNFNNQDQRQDQEGITS